MTETQFEHIFREYFGAMVNIAFSVVKDRDEARDITQQVFIKFWDRREDVDIEDNIKSYLHRAVVNTSLNHLEKIKRLQLEDDVQNAVREQFFTTEKPELKTGELKTAIENAIKNLPDKCQTVFSLSRYQGMTNREIADYLEVSVKAVEKHISRALRELRQTLAPYKKLLEIIVIFEVGVAIVQLLLGYNL